MGEGFRPSIEQPNQENPSPEQNPESLESALSPEVVEAIMAKVQDINEQGTAFSVVTSMWPIPKLDTGEGKLESIFRNGLVGTTSDQPGMQRHIFNNPTNKEIYIEQIKRKSHPEVFFSINGRMTPGPENYQKISIFFYYFGNHKDDLAIIFDISSFEEIAVNDKDFLRNKTFSLHDSFYSKEKNEKRIGRSRANIETGFRLSPRVSPRLFSGIIFEVSRKLTEQEHEKAVDDELRKDSYASRANLENWEKLKYIQEIDRTILLKRAQEIAKEMVGVNEKKPERLVPIYDYLGNLLWPKQMSYDEVKKFVVERDAGKKE